MSIRIIKPTPGPSTQENLLNLLREHPEGLSLLNMSQQLNRPVSMLHRCLKILIATKAIQTKYNPQIRQYLYHRK